MPEKVIHLISSFARGGKERQLAGILKAENSTYISKAIVYRKSSTSYEEEYGLTEKLIYLHSKSAISRFFEILHILKNEKPILVWSWGGIEALSGLIISLLTPIKHINGSIRHGIVLNNMSHQWRKLILKLSRNVVANSRAGIQANGLSRGFVLYNGLDESFFENLGANSLNNDSKSITGLKNHNKPLLISVANLVPIKDYSTVLRALEIIRNNGTSFTYLIIGDGPNRLLIENEIKEKNLTSCVKILGSRQDVGEILLHCDIFIHSSQGEGCSNAILEALAAGLPVIASNTGGTQEIINGSVGFLFDYKNHEQLAKYIDNLIADKNKQTVMKIAAKKYARDFFSNDKMMNEYNRIVTKVAHNEKFTN